MSQPAQPSAARPAAKPRPTSPHLTIYRPQITSVLSILHRITGVALSVGFVVLVGWLVALAMGPECFGNYNTLLLSPVGKILLTGWLVAFFYHLGAGIRHIAWDMGYGFALPQVQASGVAVLIFTALAAGASAALLWGLL